MYINLSGIDREVEICHHQYGKETRRICICIWHNFRQKTSTQYLI